MPEIIPTFPPSRPFVLIGATLLLPIGLISLLLGTISPLTIIIAAAGAFSLLLAIRTTTQKVVEEPHGLQDSNLFRSRLIPFEDIRFLRISDIRNRCRPIGRRIDIRTTNRSITIHIERGADEFAARWIARSPNAIFVDADQLKILPPRAGLNNDSLRALRKTVRILILQRTARATFLAALISVPLTLMLKSYCHVPNVLALALPLAAAATTAIISPLHSRTRIIATLGQQLTTPPTERTPNPHGT
ncbi:MAG: hypothetical protein ACTHN5_10635 [Phycisphaerae bacterium]